MLGYCVAKKGTVATPDHAHGKRLQASSCQGALVNLGKVKLISGKAYIIVAGSVLRCGDDAV